MVSTNYISIKEALIQNYQKHFVVLDSDQVGVAIYSQWIGLMNALYLMSERINEYLFECEWNSIDDIYSWDEYRELRELFSGMKELIGEISGALLVHDMEYLLFFVEAYRSVKAVKNSIRFDCYKRICEESISRKVVIQELKGEQILKEEIEEKRSCKKYKERLRKRKRNITITRKSEQESAIRNIDFTSFVIVCSIFKCEKEHRIETIRALIEVLLPNGRTCVEEISAGYCKECNKYFILEHDYEQIRAKGILLCQMISEKKYRTQQIDNNSFSNLKPESILYQCGYNVNAAENLTSEQRHGILQRVIDNKLYTINGVLNFLDWLIACNKNSGKRDMTVAIAKWQMDRYYVEEYQSEQQKKVRVQSIRINETGKAFEE